MTFSILAFEKETDSLGIASITSSPAHGQRCPHYKKNVGIATTQGLANRYHGETAIKLLELGFTPEECIEATKKQDINIQYRQIAIIDRMGRKAAFTGDKIKDYKGHLIGENFIATGNYLNGESVVSAMADGFVSAKGDLAERLLSAASAGEKEGGERGGAFSGFLIVTRTDDMQPWGPYVDIRIDFARDLVVSLTEGLTEYRRWEEIRLKDTNYSLDGSEPRVGLIGLFFDLCFKLPKKKIFRWL
jgi:uncharacterized Ntn-hydrolase superfamily protein